MPRPKHCNSSVALGGAWLLALIGLLPAHAQPATGTPQQTVRTFYAWVLAHPSRALPSRGERAVLARVLAPRVLQLLQDASETEARCIKVAPKGEKPDIVEGDLFVGNYEGATEVAYGSLRAEGEALVAEADLVYVDPRFPKAHPHRAVAWKDQLQLRQANGQWRVEDVRYARGKSLVAVLEEYIAEGGRSCVRR